MYLLKPCQWDCMVCETASIFFVFCISYLLEPALISYFCPACVSYNTVFLHRLLRCPTTFSLSREKSIANCKLKPLPKCQVMKCTIWRLLLHFQRFIDLLCFGCSVKSEQFMTQSNRSKLVTFLYASSCNEWCFVCFFVAVVTLKLLDGLKYKTKRR